ncbi:MAG: aspartyl/asparaginyl beta-hydroxylase domain-containing protein [Planctomycetes bacterium]|nr:aspartyl/asparaginyl beta-hydroxylase domain-containing protein [Planctomycetota bacterium]MCB9918674.1 aspartyl/asparaginyl beta-hydroxylase domain-containing protein [Planctomycetota bacterium]
MIATICVLLVVALFFGSGLWFHLRGKLRFKLRRQFGDYSILLAPYNAFACLRTEGRNRPVHDTARFPELGLLRDHWQEIRDEARSLLTEGAIQKAERQDDLVFYSFMKRGWKRFYLVWYRGFLPSAQRRAPRTVELLRQVPCVHGAMFGVLEPHSRLGKHRDPFAGTLRYHLALSTPGEGCRMQLDDIEHVWRDGEDILFDSSYVHGARNDTDQPRLVLFCDVERPMRGPISRAINRAVVRWFVPVTQVPNEPGDPTGIANRVFAWLRPLRTGMQALKRDHVRVYYTLKAGVALLIVVLLAWAPIAWLLGT